MQNSESDSWDTSGVPEITETCTSKEVRDVSLFVISLFVWLQQVKRVKPARGDWQVLVALLEPPIDCSSMLTESGTSHDISPQLLLHLVEGQLDQNNLPYPTRSLLLKQARKQHQLPQQQDSNKKKTGKREKEKKDRNENEMKVASSIAWHGTLDQFLFRHARNVPTPAYLKNTLLDFLIEDEGKRNDLNSDRSMSILDLFCVALNDMKESVLAGGFLGLRTKLERCLARMIKKEPVPEAVLDIAFRKQKQKRGEATITVKGIKLKLALPNVSTLENYPLEYVSKCECECEFVRLHWPT